MTAAYTTYKTFEGDDAGLEQRNALVLQELPQVYFIASRILERLPQHVELEDLVNAGVIGLLEACQNFDSSKNAQFKTFAKFRIRGAILDSLRVLDWGSRGLRRKAREITEATSKLEGTLGRQPTNAEIAKEMGLTTAQLDDAMTQLQGLHIVGQQAASFDGEDVYDVIESAPSTWENPFELYCKEEQKAQLAAAVAELSEREQLILSLYYVEELTMKEVAEVVGVALSRVSQIHYAALTKLKRTLGHLQADPAQDANLGQPARHAQAGQSARGTQSVGGVH
jgi:RNA polymerase sigma factor for flagellar operon FliA